MKIRAFFFCSVLVIAIIGLTLTISSDPDLDSQKSNNTILSFANNNVEQNINSPVSPPQSDGMKFFDCLAPANTSWADGLKIVSVKKREQERSKYPQIAKPRTWQERKFNSYVRKKVGGNENDTLDDGDGGGEDAIGSEDGDSGFSLTYAKQDFVSVRIWSVFCGVSCHESITPVNFDLEAGRPIKNLATMFKPGSNYLKKIASYCIGEFRRCNWGNEDDWFEKGTKPTVDNYKIWGLTSDGIEITFLEYQIAAGAFPGATVVVPYSYLRGILRQDVNWFRRLRG